jgi:hypothetical protein
MVSRVTRRVLCAALAVAALADPGHSQAGAAYSYSYDEFDRQITIVSPHVGDSVQIRTPDGNGMSASLSFSTSISSQDGVRVTGTPLYALGFLTRTYAQQFSPASELEAIIDGGEPLNLGRASAYQPVSFRGPAIETLLFVIPAAVAQRLASASTVRLRLGRRITFDLNPEQRMLFSEILSLSRRGYGRAQSDSLQAAFTARARRTEQQRAEGARTAYTERVRLQKAAVAQRHGIVGAVDSVAEQPALIDPRPVTRTLRRLSEANVIFDTKDLVLSILVGPDGRVIDGFARSLSNTPHYSLDSESTRLTPLALQALQRGQFRPLTRDGAPVAWWGTISVRFCGSTDRMLDRC